MYNITGFILLIIIFFLKTETPITENHSSQQPISEVSTIPCPRIDTQQLDRQIKAIMKEVIPFLKVSSKLLFKKNKLSVFCFLMYTKDFILINLENAGKKTKKSPMLLSPRDSPIILGTFL